MKNWQFNNYQRLFQFKSFRLFWIGFSLSVLGDTMTRVALTWFVYESTNSAWALGWLTFFYTAPVIVGGLLAGWLLDRFDRRQVIIVDSLLRAIIVILIPLLYAWGQLALWHIYVVVGIYGFLMMIPLAGGPALVPMLIPEKHLTTANALETLSFTLGGVIGPPIAGFLIAWLGAPNILILDAVSYLVFAALLSQAKPLVEDSPLAPATKQTYHLQDAFRLLRQNNILLSTTLMFMAANFGLGAMFVWLPIFSSQILGGGAELYGILLGFMAIGEVVSSILAGSLILPLTLGTLICLAQFLTGASLTLLFLGRSSWLSIASLTLFGLFIAPLTIWAQTLRMQIIPEALRGRTFALLRTLMQGANPFGGVMSGMLLPILGLPGMIGLSALIISIPGLLGYRVIDLRRSGALSSLSSEQV
jgi:MFS family permease